MKKWKILVPLGLAAAGAAAAAVLLKKKPEGSAPAAPSAAGKNAAPAPAGSRKEGQYSFISGFKDAATAEVTISYDPEKFSFAVISEEYLSYSSDSHVAVLYGEDYHVQMEYAAYYQGEDFEKLAHSIEEKFQGFARCSYGANSGVRYLDGDSFCFCFPVDEHSYLLLTAIRAAAKPEDFALLPEESAFAAMLGSIRVSLRR